MPTPDPAIPSHGLEKAVQTLRRFLELYRVNGPRPILWVGAGASAAAGYPTLGQIETILKQSLPGETQTGYALIDVFIEEYSRNDLANTLQTHLGAPKKPVGIHQAIARLAGADVFGHVFTTNYDTLLEDALKEASIPFLTQIFEQNLSLAARQEVLLLKLHGDRSDWLEVVLSQESYRRFEQERPLLVQQLNLALRQRPVVFVGCSLTDPRLLDWLKALSPGERQRLFASRAVMTEAEWNRLPASDRSLFQEANLKPVFVPDHPAVQTLFLELARLLAPVPVETLRFTLEPGPDTWTVVGPTPGSAPHSAPNPLKDPGFRTLLQELRRAGSQAVLKGQPETPGVEASLQHLARQVGERLTQVLLSDEARAAVVRRINNTELRRALLCVRVAGRDLEHDHALALPWELLMPEPGEFPVRQARLNVVREAICDGAPALPDPTGPLKVAVSVAAPEDQTRLNFEEESFRLQQSLDPLGHAVAFADLGTLDDLVQVVEKHRPAAIHFSGHGLPGQLAFEDDDGFADLVSASRLSAKLQKVSLDQNVPRPQLFYLASCYGAGVHEREAQPTPTGASTAPTRDAGVQDLADSPASEPRAGRDIDSVLAHTPSLAASLHRSGFTQVLGFFGPVDDALCTRAEESFYQALTRGKTTLEAVARARATLWEPLGGRSEHEGKAYSFPLGWTQFNLYHRGPDKPLASAQKEGEQTPIARFEREEIEVSGLPVLKHGFIGRRRQLHEARRRIRQGQKLLVLQGLGGLGKTALATRLLQMYAPLPVNQLILRGRELEGNDSPAAAVFYKQVAEHGRLHGLPDWDDTLKDLNEKNQEPVALFKVTLDTLRKKLPNLVVYADNLEPLQVGPTGPGGGDLGAWLPEAVGWWKVMEASARDGLVLASTRYAWPELARAALLEVSPMSRADTRRLVETWPELRKLPHDAKEKVSERADGHPRTLEVLDGLIHETLHRRRSQPPDVWDRVIAPLLPTLEAKLNADLVWEALWSMLPESARGHAQVLSLLFGAAPAEVVEAVGTEMDTLVRAGVLTRYAEQTQRDGTLRWVERWAMHRLVEARVQREMDQAVRAVGHRSLGMAYDAWVKGPEARWLEQVHGIQHWLAVRDGNRAWPLVRKYVLRLREQANYSEALRWLERVMEAGCDGDRQASALQLTVQMRVYLGERGDELHALLERASSFAETSDLKGSVLHERGSLLADQGKYGEAEALLRQSLSIDKASLGEAHPSLYPTLASLSVALAGQGRAAEGESCLEQALTIAQRVHGRDHPDVAQLLNLQAQHKAEMGSPDAPACARTALKALVGAFGEAHPLVQEVAPLLTHIASGGIVGGPGGTPSAPDTASSLAVQLQKGAAALKAGRLDEGLSLLMNVRQEAHRHKISAIEASACGMLAPLVAQMGQRDEALALAHRALDIAEQLNQTDAAEHFRALVHQIESASG